MLSLRDYSKNMFAPKSYPHVFIVYSLQHIEYHDLYPPTKRVHEAVFPFAHPSLLYVPSQVHGDLITFKDAFSKSQQIQGHLSSLPFVVVSTSASHDPSLELDWTDSGEVYEEEVQSVSGLKQSLKIPPHTTADNEETSVHTLLHKALIVQLLRLHMYVLFQVIYLQCDSFLPLGYNLLPPAMKSCLYCSIKNIHSMITLSRTHALVHLVHLYTFEPRTLIVALMHPYLVQAMKEELVAMGSCSLYF